MHVLTCRGLGKQANNKQGFVAASWQCRAWSISGDWQQCLVKHLAVYPGQALEGTIIGPVGARQGYPRAEATETAGDRVNAINASVDALDGFRGKRGVPQVQCAFAAGQHYTLYK